MNVNDVLIRVKRQFGDESAVQVTDDDIFRWVADAQQEIAITQNLLQTTATSSLISGMHEYSLPEDMLTLRTVLIGGRKIPVISLQEAELLVEDIDDTSTWSQAATVSTCWIWAKTLILYPVPTSDLPNGLKVRYTKTPDPVLSSVQELEIGKIYHTRVVEYCLQMAYELDEDWNGAQTKAAQYMEALAAQGETESWTERTSYPRITILPEDY